MSPCRRNASRTPCSSGVAVTSSATSRTDCGALPMAIPTPTCASISRSLWLSPLAIVFGMSFGANRFSTGTLQLLYWGFATLMGLSMSTIFLVYTGQSIATTFFATAAAFAGLSLVGYTTKKDLTAMGSFLIMGVIGILVAMVINIFLQSTILQLVVSILGVLIFAGLTAYDTQRLKMQYYQLAGTDFAGKAIVLGALSLYLDFINMFQFLLSFMGSRD